MIHLQQLELGEKLGEDVHTLLYRARRPQQPFPLLVKTYKSEYPAAAEIAMLRHEYDVLKRLDLPGVIKVLSLEPAGHGDALLMEDPGGRLLSEILASEKLSLDAALRIAIAVAHALELLHRNRIVHKAIHPRHILCDPQAHRITLMGFEIARSLDDPPAPALEREGLPAYASPEQTGRIDLDIDERSDLYSFGVTLYEMLAGVLPFRSEDPAELIHSHVARIPVPPHQHATAVPEMVSHLVMKLLAKAPGDRYPNAGAVAADLETCLKGWETGGTIGPFVLGTASTGGALRIPQKLYGRQRPLEALFAAFDRVKDGRSELFLVAGGAGMGKSVLVQQLDNVVARHDGRFISGKFDQSQRGLPFESFCQAFRDLTRRLLAEPPSRLAEWKDKIAAVAGSNGQLLIDLIPEISLVLGPQPPAAALGPMETQNRFALLLQDFVRLFCIPSRPLVLFLDDLQWADPASLSLLRILLADPTSRHMLIAGAYRDEEIAEAHPLRALLEQLQADGLTPVHITLDALDRSAVRDLLAEMLSTSGPRLDSLAALIHTKSHGNPFFLTQLLVAFHTARLVCFDRSEDRWTWDDKAIAAAPITGDLADFMVSRLRRLPPATQRLLSVAACIGYDFDLPALAALTDKTLGETQAELGEALAEGLVLPQRGGYQFLHDRVQQAAYALIDDAVRQDAHLRIGRRLRERLTDDSGAEALFATVHHLHAGAAGIDDATEREALARLSFKASQIAKASTAYTAAANLIAAAIACLNPARWDDNHDFMFLLHREQAECDLLCGDFAKADAEIDHLLDRARSDKQRAELLGLRLRLCLSQNLHAQGIAAGRAALSLLGVDLPAAPEPYEEAFRTEEAAIEQIFAVRPLESLADAPLVTDTRHETLIKLLGSMGPLTYMGDPKLAPVVMAKLVHLSLTGGQCRSSIGGYAFYAFVLASLERYPLAIRFSRLAAQLTEKFHTAEVECNVYMQLGSCAPYGEPLRLSLGYLARAQRVGLETGDHFFGSLAFLYYPIMQFRLGDPLDTVRMEIDRSYATLRRTKDVMCTVWLTALRQAVDRLQGRHGGQALWDGQPLEESEWVARLAHHFIGIPCFYHVFKLQFLLLHEDYEGALAEAAAAGEMVSAILNIHWTTELPFYESLTLTALFPTATPQKQANLLESLDRHRARLSMLAELCPANELHRLRLVDAERARIGGEHALAMKLFDEAIALAREYGFPHHEALANELCAKFHLASGRALVARAYMTEARYGYERWGATTKIKQLQDKYSELLLRDSVPKELKPASSVVPLGLLDIAAVMQATQTIGAEIVLDQLLDRFMKIIIAYSGAQKGALILKRDDRLTIDATVALDPDIVTVGQPEPLEGSSSLATTAVFYVERTREPLSLDTPRQDQRFAADPYIVSNEPKSILCLPLMHRGRLTGVLYLEHRMLHHAFPSARIQLLELMSSQAAIAIENALLYTHLEAQVSARTEELRAANERLMVELAERERLQQAHTRMQEQIIRVQNTRLLELSTPIIPITDRIMVMPIVGTIDEPRARQMLEASLQGVHESQPKVVIIDITGVRFVDPDVAGTLMRIAGALRLLGTRTVITGIRAAVAQTLIALGINLESIESRANLKMGIAYALKKTGEGTMVR